MFTPSDQNLLQGSTFQLTLSRLPYLNFFIQDLNIPGILSNPVKQITPFIDAPIPADKMVYEPFSMTFLVDEEMWSWTTINDWLKGLTFPDTFQEYKNLTLQQKIQMQGSKPQYTEAILTILSNKNNPILQFNFIDMFPVSLSGINMSVKDTALDVKTSTVLFAFTNYHINRNV